MTADLKMYAYSLLQFVPGAGRQEAVNLGVVVVSEEDSRSLGAFLYGYKQKISAVAPGVNVGQISKVIRVLRRRFGPTYQPTVFGEADPRIRSVSALRGLAGAMGGQLQLTEPRFSRAQSLEAATAAMYESLVLPVGQQRSGARPMTRSEVNRLIERTIREWASRFVVEEGEEEGHYADYWIKGGVPMHTLAALVAIPEKPGDRRAAIQLFDSIPTIVHVYQERNPDFRVIAVLPPTDRPKTDFIKEAEDRFRSQEGVIVTEADKLGEQVGGLFPSVLTQA